MHARVSTYQLGNTDAAIDQFRSALQSAGLEDVQEAVLLVDRTSGKAITITYWEDENALASSREAADRLRSRAAEGASGSITSGEEYEVVLKE